MVGLKPSEFKQALIKEAQGTNRNLEQIITNYLKHENIHSVETFLPYQTYYHYVCWAIVNFLIVYCLLETYLLIPTIQHYTELNSLQLTLETIFSTYEANYLSQFQDSNVQLSQASDCSTRDLFRRPNVFQHFHYSAIKAIFFLIMLLMTTRMDSWFFPLKVHKTTLINHINYSAGFYGFVWFMVVGAFQSKYSKISAQYNNLHRITLPSLLENISLDVPSYFSTLAILERNGLTCAEPQVSNFISDHCYLIVITMAMFCFCLQYLKLIPSIYQQKTSGILSSEEYRARGMNVAKDLAGNVDEEFELQQAQSLAPTFGATSSDS